MSEETQKDVPAMSERKGNGQFAKGHSGNKAGRPKGSIGLTGRIKEVMRMKPKEGDHATVADQLADVLVAEALKDPKGMYKFIADFMDRDEGIAGKHGGEAATPLEQAQAIQAAMQAMDNTIGAPPPPPADE